MGFVLVAIIILAVFFLLMKVISSTLDKKEEVKNEKEKCNMRECPKCGELNGDNNARCYKCNTFIGPVSSYKKICQKCGTIYDGNKSYCDTCGGNLSVYDDTVDTSYSKKSTSSVEIWMYVIGFLIPIVGLVLGCIQVGKGDKTGARNLFITSIISIVLLAIIFAVRVNKAEKELEDTVKDLQDQSSYSYNYDEYEW